MKQRVFISFRPFDGNRLNLDVSSDGHVSLRWKVFLRIIHTIFISVFFFFCKGQYYVSTCSVCFL